MYIKALKNVRWKTGTVGVSTQFITGVEYEVSDKVGKAMVEADYAEKSKGTNAKKTAPAKVEDPKNPEQDDKKDESGSEDNSDDGKGSEDTDLNASGDNDDKKEAESEKTGIFSRLKN
jgi:hypothetical protein